MSAPLAEAASPRSRSTQASRPSILSSVTNAGDWHMRQAADVCAGPVTSARSGLDSNEARERHVRFGPNRPSGKAETLWDIFVEEVLEPMILLQIATSMLYAFWGEIADTQTIFLVSWRWWARRS